MSQSIYRHALMPGAAPAKRPCWRCGKSMPFHQQACRACWESLSPAVRAAVIADEMPALNMAPGRPDRPSTEEIVNVSEVDYLAWLKYMAGRDEHVSAKAALSYIEQMQHAHKAELDATIRDAQDDLQMLMADKASSPQGGSD